MTKGRDKPSGRIYRLLRWPILVLNMTTVVAVFAIFRPARDVWPAALAAAASACAIEWIVPYTLVFLVLLVFSSPTEMY